MQLTDAYEGRQAEIIALFASSFADSEGPEEGRLIGDLAGKLLRDTPRDDLFVFLAVAADAITGAIMFTRLRYREDPRSVFLLSPVAVATASHGKGVGQKLIRHGLQALRTRGVDAVLTYGDINFYSKVGFAQIDETVAKAPLPLSFPHGWLGQALCGAELLPLAGPSTCASALNDPHFW